MKKIIALLITILLTAIATTTIIIYNLKITNIENGNITIDIFRIWRNILLWKIKKIKNKKKKG